MSSQTISTDIASPQTQGADIDQLLRDALIHLQAGALQEAEDLYRQVLDQQPDHPVALHLLGLLDYQAGHAQRAVELMERAIAAKPDFAEACKNLANIYAELELPDKAVAGYRQALAIAPNLIEAHYNLGALFQHQDRWDEAKNHYQEALVIKPDFVEARDRLGEVLRLLAQAAAARRDGSDLFADALLLEQRQKAQDLCNKAALCQKQGKVDEAIAYYQQAIAVKPDFAEAHNDLGNLLVTRGQFKKALASYQNVIALAPDSFIGYNQVGNILRLQKRLEHATASFQHAIALDPQRAQLYLNLGLVLKEQDKLDAAGAMCERALRLQPDLADAFATLAQIRIAQGRVGIAIELLRQRHEHSPDEITISDIILFNMHYLPGFSPEDFLAAAKSWAARHGAQQRYLPPPANLPDPQRRLRVGYVSADLNNHPVGYLIEAVLAQHDKSRYEVFCYYNDCKQDDLTARLQQSADHWRDIMGKSDQEAAQQIRRDGIDLLIDLSGHTTANRLMIFTLKPAPVQATWLGYFNTTGLDTMDYIIADRFVIPPGDERYYVEQVVRLPDAYNCFSPPKYVIEPGPLPALATGKVTFGCFNNTPKLTAAVIACWSKLLHALPDAQLYLKSKPFGDAGVRQRYHGLFAQHGIAPERIRFAGNSPRHELLAAYHEVDIALDPFPYNGGLTTLEALWMGVPVVSLSGDRFVSRVGMSLLNNLGLGECVADTEDAYVARAAALAADLPRLAELRSRLRQQLQDSPLCDGPGFTRNLEAAYRTLWESWCSTRSRSNT